MSNTQRTRRSFGTLSPRPTSFWSRSLALWALFSCFAVHAQTVTLNLQDADISALITTVSEVTGKNFIVDPRVKGKVTVVSARPLQDKEVYQVFLSVLKVHGFVAIQSGEVVKIVPEATGKTESIPTAATDPGVRGDALVTRVIPVVHVSAAKLVPVLRPLIPQQGHLAADVASNVLIISDTASNVARMLRIVRRIDAPTKEEIEVIPLQHASAADVVKVLASLTPKGRSEAAPPPVVVADERTNSVLVNAERTARLRIRAVVTHLDTPLADGGNTSVVYLRHADAADLVPILEGITGTLKANTAGGQKKSVVRSGREVSIQADENVNALVITAGPAMQKTLAEVIKKLDIRRAQVLVEAIIADISSDQAAELGIQWRSTTEEDSRGVIGGTNFNLTGNGINQISTNPLSVGDGLSLGFLNGASTLLGTDFLNIAALLRVLHSDADANVLSTPSLVTLDNEEAEIVIARNVPFVTGQFTNTGASDSAVNPFQTITREDVGIILRVRPQINEGDSLKLAIEQEVSSVIPSAVTQGAVDLVTNKRSIKTTVLVDDGKLLVLGGLIDEDLQQSFEKIPLLGDIPGLGQLFRYDRTTKTKRNLIVFLRPRILRGDMDVSISRSKYDNFRSRQSRVREQGVRLLPDDSAPVLPAIDGPHSAVRQPESPFNVRPSDPNEPDLYSDGR